MIHPSDLNLCSQSKIYSLNHAVALSSGYITSISFSFSVESFNQLIKKKLTETNCMILFFCPYKMV